MELTSTQLALIIGLSIGVGIIPLTCLFVHFNDIKYWIISLFTPPKRISVNYHRQPGESELTIAK